MSFLLPVALAATAPQAFDWLRALFTTDSGALMVAHAVLILAAVTAIGLAVGTIRIFGISLGVAGVLFAGLAFAHFGLTINHEVMEFARDFGLILFVYTIGLQVGPGFLSSLRRAGLKLNLLAAAIVVLSVITTLVVVQVTASMGDKKIEIPIAVGLLSGGTTNTPSLAAAQQALKEVSSPNAETSLPPSASGAASTPQTPIAKPQPPKPDVSRLPGLGYAIAYPFGVMGIIVTMMLVRFLFRVDVAKENETISRLQTKGPALDSINLEVTNANLDYLPIGAVPLLNEPGVVVSRVLQANKPYVAAPDTILHLGDILHVVGPKERLQQIKLVIGSESRIDVKAIPSDIVARRMVVTRTAALGKSIEELALLDRFGATITRVARAEVEIPASADWHFQFGDQALVVGTENAIKQVAAVLGDSVKKLDHPQIIPLFVGIALGVLFGSWPIYIPGMPAPVKLGLAGGPLLVAIILARIGQIGKLSWYMPRSANFALRELGIVLFLACVGLKAGDGFVDTLVAGNGLYWMAVAAVITLLPLLLVALFARLVYKTNYVSLCGLLAGSMTDPPALAFANTMVGSESPSIAYATVYPLTMILRVISAQALVLFFYR